MQYPSVPVTPGLPLRHEQDVDGVAASVFRDIRRRMPFVPALFKALAHDPDALLAAWLQARALYDDPQTATVAAGLRAQSRPGLALRPPLELRAAVRPFVEELPFMLLIATSLGLTLEGELPLRRRPAANLPPAGPVREPEFSDRGEHPLFVDICRAYNTQHLPSIYRMLAARGLLEESWAAIGPFLTSARGRMLAAELSATAAAHGRRFPEVAFCNADSARAIVDQLRPALPRNLIFASAASGA